MKFLLTSTSVLLRNIDLHICSLIFFTFPGCLLCVNSRQTEASKNSRVLFASWNGHALKLWCLPVTPGPSPLVHLQSPSPAFSTVLKAPDSHAAWDIWGSSFFCNWILTDASAFYYTLTWNLWMKYMAIVYFIKQNIVWTRKAEQKHLLFPVPHRASTSLQQLRFLHTSLSLSVFLFHQVNMPSGPMPSAPVGSFNSLYKAQSKTFSFLKPFLPDPGFCQSNLAPMPTLT